MIIKHPLKPIYNQNSKILILGSFPSIKSREQMFYYAHPKNQFWSIMSEIFQEEIIDKTDFLLKHNIALFDVIKSCEITGSLDSSIKNIKVNDIKNIVVNSKIKYIFTTGQKAYQLYNKYLKDDVLIDAICLPSTSPLYSKMKYEEKLEKYHIIKEKLNN